ncbi:MAG: DNA polymerase III subunit delta [Lachnospiraceae bacterium]|nr:DNA polymerase III subunit delta [Lachnospiraceae bacterium]
MRDVRTDVKNKNFAPVYLIFGEEAYIRKNYRNQLTSALVAPGDSLNYTAFSGNDIDAGEVVSLAMTMPFMAEKRVICVKDSGFFKKSAEDIADYLENPSPDTVLIFDESAVDKKTRTYKAAKKAGFDVEAQSLKGKKLQDWVAANFKRNGKLVKEETVKLLIDRVSGDLSTLDAEISKLSSYAGDRESVSSEDVMLLVPRSPSYNVYQMIEAIGNKKVNLAVGIYYDMMVEKQNAYGVFSLIASHFRRMLVVSDMGARGAGLQEIMDELGLADWQVNKYITQARKFTRAKMVRAIEECVRAPREIFQGKIQEEAAMELLIIGVASE